MGLRELVRSALSGFAPEQKSVIYTPTWQRGMRIPLPLDYITMAEQGYAKNEIVFACIRRIAQSVCEPKLRVLLKDRETRAPRTHRLYSVINEPNDMMSFLDLLEATVTMMLIGGNAYWQKERNVLGQTRQLWPMRPDRVSIEPGATGVSRYVYTLGDIKQYFAAEDVLHFKWHDPKNDWYGLSPLQVCARIADADNERTDFTRAFFANAGVPFGLLKTKQKIKRAEAEHIKQMWRENYSGSDKWHNIAVLDEDADYKQLGLSQTDMAFPELTAVSEARICLAFGVPPVLVGAYVGLQESTYSNYEQARAAFWEDTMMPLIRKLEDSLNHGLAEEYDCYIDMDTVEVMALQEDRNTMWERANAAVVNGWAMVNEARTEAGLSPIPGQDVFLRPFGTQTVDKSGNIMAAPNPMQPMGEGDETGPGERPIGRRENVNFDYDKPDSRLDSARIDRPRGGQRPRRPKKRIQFTVARQFLQWRFQLKGLDGAKKATKTLEIIKNELWPQTQWPSEVKKLTERALREDWAVPMLITNLDELLEREKGDGI